MVAYIRSRNSDSAKKKKDGKRDRESGEKRGTGIVCELLGSTRPREGRRSRDPIPVFAFNGK